MRFRRFALTMYDFREKGHFLRLGPIFQASFEQAQKFLSDIVPAGSEGCAAERAVSQIVLPMRGK